MAANKKRRTVSLGTANVVLTFGAQSMSEPQTVVAFLESCKPDEDASHDSKHDILSQTECTSAASQLSKAGADQSEGEGDAVSGFQLWPI